MIRVAFVLSEPAIDLTQFNPEMQVSSIGSKPKDLYLIAQDNVGPPRHFGMFSSEPILCETPS